MIKREISQTIKNHIRENKILVLKAPAFSGRTDLIMAALPQQNAHLIFDVSDKKTHARFHSFSKEAFRELVGQKKFIIIREAQLLSKLQEIIELVLLEEGDLNLICICSFAPPLDDLLTEVLNQNGLILEVQAPTFKELANQMGLIPFEKSLEERLIFGNYPAVINDSDNKSSFLINLSTHLFTYPFSTQERINKKEKLKKMLQFIAFHIGEQLSYNQIGLKCGLDNETVERYIEMLEKAFILIKLPIYSTGQRYELSKMHCFYFYDNGIRNACIQNFNDFDLRNDCNELWKNWIISEKMKKIQHDSSEKSIYFWNTHTKQHIDLIEISSEQMKAFQIIWDKTDKFKIPSLFQKYYPKSLNFKINRASYWSFLAKD